MENQNFFALLGDNESEASAIIANYVVPATAEEKPAVKKQAPAKLPSKPSPPAEAVREAQRSQTERGRGRGGRRGGRVGGRGDDGGYSREGGYPRDVANGDNARRYQGGRGRGGYYGDRPHADGAENGQVSDGGYRGRGRGGGRGRVHFNVDSQEELLPNGAFEDNPEEAREEIRRPEPPRARGERTERGERTGERGERGERTGERGERGDRGEQYPPRRQYDRRNTTGRSFAVKRDGAGRGNWGTVVDPESVEETINAEAVNEDVKLEVAADETKDHGEGAQETPENGEGKKDEEEEDNEMTLDEYEKVMEEKRKALLAMKSQERKVEADKAFEAMQLVDKKSDDDIFIKLGSEKDKAKKKEAADKEDKSKKSVSINEFLKSEAENYQGGGRGRGRGRGFRGGFGGYNNSRRVSAPPIEDPHQFPALGGGM